jgi:tetratricopeptide (TPR) repeat protein
MQRPQLLVVAVAVLALLTMYFGCPTQAPEMVSAAARRGLEVEATSPGALMRTAKDDLSPIARATLAGLDDQLADAETDKARLPLLERLATEWYQAGQAGISGHFAQRIAEIRDTSARAWSIAGTTFSICVQKATTEKEKTFCTQRSVQAFQNAISLEPAVVDHQLNLSLTYTYSPPEENPMKGILMLRDLQAKYPQNTAVLITLARLAIQTNQLQKATERLQQATALEPLNPEPVCLLAQVYGKLGLAQKEAESGARCAELTSQPNS